MLILFDIMFILTPRMNYMIDTSSIRGENMSEKATHFPKKTSNFFKDNNTGSGGGVECMQKICKV